MEEIKEATFQEDAPIYMGDMEVDGYVRASRIEEIIRSHMNDGNDTNVTSNWIPVEERLPEEGKEVLAQFVVKVRHTNGKVDEAVYIYPLHYEEGKWKSFHGMPNGKVEAWQPLPETYKGGKENG